MITPPTIFLRVCGPIGCVCIPAPRFSVFFGLMHSSQCAMRRHGNASQCDRVIMDHPWIDHVAYSSSSASEPNQARKKKIQAPRTTGPVSPGKMTTKERLSMYISLLIRCLLLTLLLRLTEVCLDRPSYGGRTLLTLSTEPHMYAQRGVISRNQRERTCSGKCEKKNNKRFPKLRLQREEPASSNEKIWHK